MGRIVCSVSTVAVLTLLLSIPAFAVISTPQTVPDNVAVKIAKPAAESVAGHLKEIGVFALSQDGRLALTGDEDENNLLWDVASGKLLRAIGIPDAVHIPLVAAAFSADSSQLLWSRYKKTTPVFWDVKTGKRLSVMPSKDKGHDAEVVSIALSQDGRYIATGDQAGVICFWNAKDRKLLRRYKAHDSDISYLSFIPGRNEFVSVGADGGVKLWSTEDDKSLAELKAPGETVSALLVSQDGGVLYVATSESTIRGWNIALRSLRGSIALDDRQVNGIDLSPDADRMAMVGEDGSLMLWNLRDSRPLWKKDLDSSALFVRFSADGLTIITAGGDNWVRVWDTASGKLLRRFAGVDE